MTNDVRETVERRIREHLTLMAVTLGVMADESRREAIGSLSDADLEAFVRSMTKHTRTFDATWAQFVDRARALQNMRRFDEPSDDPFADVATTSTQQVA